jgi:hypothetical protein
VIAVAPDASKYLIAAFVSGDLAGRVWLISTSVIVMADCHSGDEPKASSLGSGSFDCDKVPGWKIEGPERIFL